jgi:hypothetical protein
LRWTNDNKLMNTRNHHKLIMLFVLLCSVSTGAFAGNSDNWQLVIDKDPLTKQTACLMVSATRTTQDGQTTTPVYLLYDGNTFIAKTKSNIDTSYENTGLQVDLKNPHDIDRILDSSSAVFDLQADAIRDEFIKGLRARLTLGFWPTWPKTKSYTIEFSLRGFTATYNAFQRCKKTGEVL